jgi:superoxide reductase
VGEKIPHPNTIEHFIGWIELFFIAEGGKFAIQLGRAEFSAHGDVATEPAAVFSAKLPSAGTLMAASYCNLHGLWESEKAIKVG